MIGSVRTDRYRTVVRYAAIGELASPFDSREFCFCQRPTDRPSTLNESPDRFAHSAVDLRARVCCLRNLNVPLHVLTLSPQP
jgi:hypothetical protein